MVCVFFGPLSGGLHTSDADTRVGGAASNTRLGQTFWKGDLDGDTTEDLVIAGYCEDFAVALAWAVEGEEVGGPSATDASGLDWRATMAAMACCSTAARLDHARERPLLCWWSSSTRA